MILCFALASLSLILTTLLAAWLLAVLAGRTPRHDCPCRPCPCPCHEADGCGDEHDEGNCPDCPGGRLCPRDGGGQG